MIRRDPMSNLFIATCSGCGLHEHIDSDSGFGAASLATAAGWALSSTAGDRCRDCARAATSGKRSPR